MHAPYKNKVLQRRLLVRQYNIKYQQLMQAATIFLILLLSAHPMRLLE
jgi:hypothetical protein